jgi:hypothetical protein
MTPEAIVDIALAENLHIIAVTGSQRDREHICAPEKESSFPP